MAKSVWILLLLYLLCIPSDGQETGCVTFDLENNLEDQFASDLDCAQVSAFGPWEHSSYDELDIALDVRGTRFIRPGATGSCSRTLEVFPVVSGGIVEVNCFMQMAEGSTGVAYVNVLAQNYADGSLVGVGVINSNMNGNGWHNLRIDNINESVGSVYIVLTGMVPPESTLLIDSFRYAHNENQLDGCDIYTDEPPSEEDTTSESTEEELSPEDSAEPTTSESTEEELSPEDSAEPTTSESTEEELSPEDSAEPTTSESTEEELSPEDSAEPTTSESTEEELSPEDSAEPTTSESTEEELSPEDSAEPTTSESTEEELSPEDSAEPTTSESTEEELSPEDSAEPTTSESTEEELSPEDSAEPTTSESTEEELSPEDSAEPTTSESTEEELSPEDSAEPTTSESTEEELSPEDSAEPTTSESTEEELSPEDSAEPTTSESTEEELSPEDSAEPTTSESTEEELSPEDSAELTTSESTEEELSPEDSAEPTTSESTEEELSPEDSAEPITSESTEEEDESKSEEIEDPIIVPGIWNGWTIAAVVVLSLVFVAVVAIVGYILGRRSNRTQTPPLLYLTEGELPISYIVPRIPTAHGKQSHVLQGPRSLSNGNVPYNDRNYLSDEWVGRSYDRNYPRDERSRSPNSDWARQHRESNYPSLEWSRYRDRERNYSSNERSKGYY